MICIIKTLFCKAQSGSECIEKKCGQIFNNISTGTSYGRKKRAFARQMQYMVCANLQILPAVKTFSFSIICQYYDIFSVCTLLCPHPPHLDSRFPPGLTGRRYAVIPLRNQLSGCLGICTAFPEIVL